jgi:hypothetical protein
MVNGDTVRALRYAREVADDLRWRGMAVPPVYAGMAEEFRALVQSGGYARWIASLDRLASRTWPHARSCTCGAPPADRLAVVAVGPARMPPPRAFAPG